MAPRVQTPPELQRRIRTEYAARTPEGHWQFSVLEVATRNGITVYTVYRIARVWGLSRYMTTGRH